MESTETKQLDPHVQAIFNVFKKAQGFEIDNVDVRNLINSIIIASE